MGGSCVKNKMERRHKSRCPSRALTSVAAVLFFAAGARAASAPIPHGTLELIAENQSIAPGHEFHLGLHFQLEKGWHIYWVNPGDSGEPPRVKWQLPAGLTAGEMEWPTPQRLGTATIVDFGYEDDVMLLVPMHAEAGLAALDAGGDFADGVVAYEGSWLGADAFISFDGQAVKLLEAQGAIARLLS